MKIVMSFCAFSLALGLVAARGQETNNQTKTETKSAKKPDAKEEKSPVNTKEVAVIKTTEGEMVVEFWPEVAPKTVENFLSYVRSGHYDNTVFHRVIDGFMIQGGGFEPGMRQKPTQAQIENEATNGLKNERYTVAMARTSDPHSASAQFFINVKDNSFLNHSAPTPQGWGYCVFGKVVEGMDVVDKIKSVKTGSRGGHQDVPVEDVVLERAEAV